MARHLNDRAGTSDTLDPTSLVALHDRVNREVDAGRIPSAQLAVGLDGEVVHVEAFGDARVDTRFAVFSVTKALIAATVWQLLGDGTLEIDTPVLELVPSFEAAHGVTLKHLLTHTGGFPFAPLGPPRWNDAASRAEQYRRWQLRYPPGEHYEYHPTAGHWIIAEMIEATEGRDYRRVVAERVIEPLGLSRFLLGGDDAAEAEVAELELVGEPPTPAEIEEVFGIPDVDLGEVTPEILLHFNDPEVRRVGVPAAGGISDAATLAAFYQHLMANTDAMWNPSVLADGTARVHCDLPDPLTGVPANRTLGLVLAGDDGRSALRGMGHTVSPQAFGHNGAGGQICWVDPATGISFAFCTSGLEQNFIHESRRTAAIGSRAGALLG